MVVEPDDEQVQIARGARHSGELLLVAVEHRLPGQREPIAVPAARIVPVGGPDVVVEPDDEQVQIARGARHSGELLLVAVEDCLPRQREPIVVPALSHADLRV